MMSICSLPVELLMDILQIVASNPTPRTISRICSVCRYWRNVCIETPMFWTRIEVGDCKVCNYMFSSVFLVRCQGSPIDLVAGQLHNSHSQGMQTCCQSDQNVSAALTPYLHQVRSVAMYPGIATSGVLLSLLRGSVVPMPLLQSVRLYNNSGQQGTICWTPPHVDQSLRIHTLHLDRVYIPLGSTVLRDMVHLRVEMDYPGPHPSMAEMLSILANSPRMQTLKLRWAGPRLPAGSGRIPSPAMIVKLTLLQELYLVNTTLNIAYIISHLDIPRTTKVQLEATGGDFADLLPTICFPECTLIKHVSAARTLRLGTDRFLEHVTIHVNKMDLFFTPFVHQAFMLTPGHVFDMLRMSLDHITAPPLLSKLTLTLSRCHLTKNQWSEIISHPKLSNLKSLSISHAGRQLDDLFNALYTPLRTGSAQIGIPSFPLLERLTIPWIPSTPRGKQCFEQYLKRRVHAGVKIKELKLPSGARLEEDYIAILKCYVDVLSCRGPTIIHPRDSD